MIEKELSFASEFPPVSYDEWKAEAIAELKGVPFEKKLVHQTLDGIGIQPLYTAADWPSDSDASGFPGFMPMTRGSEPLGHAAEGWDIHQEHLHPQPIEANKTILEDLQHGVTSIRLRLDAAASAGLDASNNEATELCGNDGVMAYSLGDFDAVLNGVRLDIAPVSIDAGGGFLPSAALLAALLRQRGVDAKAVRCGFNADPLGALMSEGQLSVSLDVALEQMADLAAWTAANYPHATAVQVSTEAYHHAGASSTQDLAFATATALEYLRAMTRAGLDFDTAVSQIAFSMSIGCQFFQAIAKLRALRKMWAKVITTCNGSEMVARATRIHIRTSRRVLTRHDPWINLLRNAVCCFAGAVGGADAITTAPLDAAIGLSDEFSRHLARNTQIIALEESHLNRVIDPPGGSWFLERLTDELAQRGWALLQQIEQHAGMRLAATSGWVAQQIGSVEAARERNLATRRQIVTGISEHPLLTEQQLVRPHLDRAQLRVEASARLVSWRRDHPGAGNLSELAQVAKQTSRTLGALTEAAVKAAEAGATLGEISAAIREVPGTDEPARAQPLAIHPYAAAYEELRDASDRFAARTGKRPLVFLANIGTPAEFIARSTYALNFFEAGGFQVINNDGFSDQAALAAAFTQSQARSAVICSSDKEYQKVAEKTAETLKASGARTVILAGNPRANEAKYRAAGVDRFIFVRCDVLGILRELLKAEGVLS
ncbi:MAG: methylmalonyl-CoA mutase small subunit [Deltaproteobacteria bacterium]|nr:methylmalonyl-CoA mutase small subunit [Deltaproteobacteria bacterium]